MAEPNELRHKMISTSSIDHNGVVVTALITGVTGQDGGYLTERLIAEGARVHGLVAPGHDEPTDHVPGWQRHALDLTDHDGVRRLLFEITPDEIYNLAAISSVARSWREPERVAAVNGTAAVRLMESALALQHELGRPVRVVQASSAEIFGDPAVSPQDETTPIRPVTPYGAAKAHAHTMAGRLRDRGLAVSALVLYNHESPRRPPTFVTRRITVGVAKIARGEIDRLALGNLEAVRDWGWAPDYVDAMVRAARTDRSGDYVIASGQAHTVRDFVTAAFAQIGVEDWSGLVDVEDDLLRPADARRLVGDAARARAELGWAPTVGFADLVARMVEADLRRT